MQNTHRYLMCEPRHFEVGYAINPWMDPAVPVDAGLARRQWSGLADTYRSLGHTVELIEPAPGLPDMVFAANGGFTLDGKALGARFRHAERAAEGELYEQWFKSAGLEALMPEAVCEGEGDLLHAGTTVLAGTGFRTDPAAHREAQEFFGIPFTTLELVDPRFYHLDTALFVLDDRPGSANVCYWPGAFTPGSRAVLERLFPEAVLATEEDAAVFGLNSISDGSNIVLAAQAERLAGELSRRGYRPVPVDVSELRKAGGGAKCCTLEVRS